MKEKIANMGKMIWKHKFIFGGAALLIAGTLYYGYNKNLNTEEDGGIQTAEVQKGDIEILITGSGQIHSNSQVDLQGVAAGDGIDVVEVTVKNDQGVKQDDLIALLDTTEPMKSVRNAQLSLQTALINQKETNRLYDNQTVEEKWQRQQQEINVQQRQSSLSDAYNDLQDYYIRAPFDGIVTGLSVEAGDSISREDIIASVITKEMYAEISLNEVDAAKVKDGNKVVITFDALSGVSMEGEVTKIDTIGEVVQNIVSYNAKIDFESTSKLLKPGMSVNAEIAVESRRNVLQVLISAIKTDNDGNSFVQMVDVSDSSQAQANTEETFKLVRQPIEIGITDDVVTEITKGLEEGDIIVTKINTSSSSSSQNDNRSLLDSVRIPGAGSSGRGR